MADVRHPMSPLVDVAYRGVTRVSRRRGGEFWWHQRRRAGDPMVRVTCALVGPGDTVLDIGGDWGVYTAGLARLVSASGTVYTFEPNPADHAALEQVRAGRENIVIQRIALSDRAGRATLHVMCEAGAPVNAMGSLASPLSRTWQDVIDVEVPTARLDDVLPADTPVRFVKCDVEGHEFPVLRGAAQLFSRQRPSLLIEIEQRHSAVPVGETFELLAGWGYRGFFIAGGTLRPLEQFDLERDQLAHLDAAHEVTDHGAYVNDFVFVAGDDRVQQLRLALD